MNKKYSKISFELTTLTPTKAQALLDGQVTEQRKLVNRYVSQYKDAMDRGLWNFDGATIKIDWFGEMIDGQHRCSAVVKSGRSIKCLIVYGLAPKVRNTVDTGRGRTLGDLFKVNGEKHYSALAGAVGLLMRYANGAVETKCVVQRNDALEFLDTNPELRESVDYTKSQKNCSAVLAPTIAAAMHFLFSKKNDAEADYFFEKLATGEGFKKKDPIRVLRDKLLFNRQDTKRYRRSYVVAIVIKAWNAYRLNKPMTTLNWRTTKRPEEPMPKII